MTFQLKAADHFEWLPNQNTVLYRLMRHDRDRLQLLHELSHALLAHTPPIDKERYAIERAAWQLTRELALLLDIPISERFIARDLQAVAANGYPLPHLDE